MSLLTCSPHHLDGSQTGMYLSNVLLPLVFAVQITEYIPHLTELFNPCSLSHLLQIASTALALSLALLSPALSCELTGTREVVSQ